MEREEEMKKSAVTQLIYLTVYCVLCILEVYIMPTNLLTVLCIVGGAYLVIHTFFIKYNKDWLFVNGLLSAFIVLQFSILIGKDLDLKSVVAWGVAISVIDALSFTKAGKHTVNGQAMAHTEIRNKLVVYGRGKKGVLYPTCGIGDYFYYALWIAGLLALTNHMVYLIIGSALIIIGSAINAWIISKLYKKDKYKGIPATIIPFICIIAEYVIIYLLR